MSDPLSSANVVMEQKPSKFGLFLRGIAMGAADVVPGVSGGTIAFITGIYSELICSIASFDYAAFKLLLERRLPDFWQHTNGTFLVLVFAGIATSILSLAHLITWLLQFHPKLVWSFFFGLIITSAIIMVSHISLKNLRNLMAIVIGASAAYTITLIPSSIANPSPLYLYMSGAIAICAMILPGISGSFILLVLGVYTPVLQSIKDFELKTIVIFTLGCATGLLGFARLLNWMLSKYPQTVISLLIGFMVGSSVKVWPWKLVDDSGIEVNVLPNTYMQFDDGDPQYLLVTALAILGIITIFIANRLSSKTLTGNRT